MKSEPEPLGAGEGCLEGRYLSAVDSKMPAESKLEDDKACRTKTFESLMAPMLYPTKLAAATSSIEGLVSRESMTS